MQFFSIIDGDISRIKGRVVSVIGGGGKSSLIHKVGRELQAAGLRVILTSTTKLQEFDGIPLLLHKKNRAFFKNLKTALDENKIVLVAEDYYKSEKLQGVSPTFVSKLSRYADIVLIEADGSRQRALKTHKAYEPVIPVCSQQVIIICAATIVGQRLNDETVHRAELFADKWGLPFGTVLTPEMVVNELTSPDSYLRNIPLKAEVSYLVNKEDLNPDGGQILAEQLAKHCHHPVYLGSLRQNSLQKVS